MNDLDNITKLAFSLHSNLGVYALLLGSGVSRGAGIPTGWEIVEDLIKKIAQAEGEDIIDNPESWYLEYYHEKPEYTKLLDKITNTKEERSNLLKSYFEPTEEDIEAGLKIPTQAHKAIASLVKNSYIKIILTTNFDHLIERALEDKGIAPTVISTEDMLEGSLPYVHSRCVVVKLHGDYTDSRIKNTPDELSEYSDILNSYIDRIFDEFGLIICGWSAEWDEALRNALYRRKNRRFSCYWTTRGTTSDEAKKVIDHLKAEIIQIDDADKFFTELLEKVEAIEEYKKPHPLSIPMAIATVKKYLADEHNRIRLFDLFKNEVERVYAKFNSDQFEISASSVDDKIFQKRMREYEELFSVLVSMLTTTAYFDTRKNTKIVTKSIERFVERHYKSGNSLLGGLQLYPALLLVYATGMAALASENYTFLRACLTEPVFRENKEKKPAVKEVNKIKVFEYSRSLIPHELRDEGRKPYTPASDYIHKLLRDPLKCCISDDRIYDEIFDIFEYLLGLVYIHLCHEDLSEEKVRWAPVGRFGWKYCSPTSWTSFENSPIHEFLNKSEDDNYSLILELFRGRGNEKERFNLCLNNYKRTVSETCSKWTGF